MISAGWAYTQTLKQVAGSRGTQVKAKNLLNHPHLQIFKLASSSISNTRELRSANSQHGAQTVLNQKLWKRDPAICVLTSPVARYLRNQVNHSR